MEPLNKSEIPNAVKGLIILVVLGFVVYLIFGDNNDKKTSAIRKETSTNEQQVKDIDAIKLYVAYQENEIAADRKYKGKRFRVSGEISEISKGPMDGIYISILVPGTYSQIQCEDMTEDEAGVLKKGEMATIEGTCGGMTLGSVFLEKCMLVR
jgi:tRNA_anti-like